MTQHEREIIDDVLHGGLNPDFERIVGTYRFDVDGRGSCLIKIDHGTISVSEGTGEATCVLSCSAEDFEPIISGRQNLLTAHMQGRLRIEGSPVMALRFINTINSRAPALVLIAQDEIQRCGVRRTVIRRVRSFLERHTPTQMVRRQRSTTKETLCGASDSSAYAPVDAVNASILLASFCSRMAVSARSHVSRAIRFRRRSCDGRRRASRARRLRRD